MSGRTKLVARSVGYIMALSAINVAWAQYLTGTDRASFVAGSVHTCMGRYGTGNTALIPKPLYEQYCGCYANGLADRVSANDLVAENPAVVDPIIRAESRRCYELMKADAIRILRQQSN